MKVFSFIWHIICNQSCKILIVDLLGNKTSDAEFFHACYIESSDSFTYYAFSLCDWLSVMSNSIFSYRIRYSSVLLQLDLEDMMSLYWSLHLPVAFWKTSLESFHLLLSHTHVSEYNRNLENILLWWEPNSISYKNFFYLKLESALAISSPLPISWFYCFNTDGCVLLTSPLPFTLPIGSVPTVLQHRVTTEMLFLFTTLTFHNQSFCSFCSIVTVSVIG